MWTIRVWLDGRELNTKYLYQLEWAAERMASELRQLKGIRAEVAKIREGAKEDETI